ncbi:MAG: signal transduction histidine kinase/CheY-like chemotaxis protein [Pseudohongiellaceae bacterium]|jgi:signal transduction histidine kinase/CheY-like chemotaxis protein/HPt (histidine-containing phosphotransfer) domain-containing protein
MLDIGTIPVLNEESIVHFRSKIRNMAIDLHFSTVEATRIATACSEISWHYLEVINSFTVEVFIEKVDEKYGLLLVFPAISKQLKCRVFELLFDHITLMPGDNEKQKLHTFNFLRDVSFVPSLEFIADQKVKISKLSRDELVEELREAKKIAETAAESKATFLASMSHEIRTPMNGVLGMVDILRQTELAGDQKKMLDTISDSGQALLSIINDILDFSKIEAGRMDLEEVPFSILNVVEGSAQMIAANATKKGLRLITYVDPNIPAFLVGDQVRLRQILINLGGNAIKFTRKGSVVIRAEQVGNSDTQFVTIRFSVVDQGIGLSKDGQAKLFQAYSQAESSTTREFGGTGLGLTICKTLTTLMNGEIGVNSELGEGAEFFTTIRFPVSNSQVQKGNVTSLVGLRVLLVTSDPITRGILRLYLEHWGVEIDSCDDFDHAVSSCKSALDVDTAFDVVVLGSQWSQKEVFSAVEDIVEIEEKTRFVFLVQGDNQESWNSRRGVFVSVDPLLRASLISGVAIASSRESPEVEYEGEVEYFKSAVKALSVEEARAKGTLILVAEDNETNRDVIERQLNLLGYTCEMAEDGKIALEAWRTNNYTVLLTDCNMPFMDGFELTASIRKDEEGTDRHANIIAITANALHGEAERCIDSGMDDYLSKPIDMQELRKKLKKWMPIGTEVEEQGPKQELYSIASDESTYSMSSKNVINESVLKNMFGNDPVIFKEILVEFIQPSKNIVEEVKSGYENHSAEDIKQAVHKLKSAAYSIGAESLGDLCQDLEAGAGDKDWDVIEGGAPKVIGLMNLVEEYILRL